MFGHNSTQSWRALDAAHHLHPFSNAASLAHEGTRVIVRAQGPYIWDSDGNRILDGMAGLWNVNIGYGRQELADAAYKQMQELPFYNTFFKTSHPPVIALSDKLSQLAPHGFNHVFYGSSGSESNDTAIRLLRHYWTLQGKPERSIILSRHWAYHGSTIAAASLGGMPGMHAQIHPRLPDIVHVMPPYAFGEQRADESEESFGLRAAQAIEDAILSLGPERVGAFAGEPIQGAGGVKIPPQSYWPAVAKILKKYDILWLADEVITGFGRMGTWFGSDYYGLEPDLITFAKAITSGYQPLSGVLVGKRIADALFAANSEFTHGYTYSGHPVACAVALANLKILEEEGMIDHTRDKAIPALNAMLAALKDHPLVGEVRSEGLLGAIEIVANKQTRKRFTGNGRAGLILRDHMFREGCIMRAVGDTLCMSPPLIWQDAQFDEALGVLKRALDLTLTALKDEVEG
jgi:putrescine---pyruvate transaminase